jgi:exodeoxyribonuclease-3
VTNFNIATINIAGLRGAVLTGKATKINAGADTWFNRGADLDICAFQETKILPLDKGYEECLNKLGVDMQDFHILPDVHKKGHGGVALWLNPKTTKLLELRAPFEEHKDSEKYCFSGRWLEADVSLNGKEITVVSAYFHHADSPTVKLMDGSLIDRNKSIHSMDSKHHFMSIATERMRWFKDQGKDFVVVGDVNIAHKEQDLKNWKGNKTKAGFLPEERAWLDLWFRNASDKAIPPEYKHNETINYNPPKSAQFRAGGLELHDICRELWGSADVYSWWSNRGHAFDNNSGWRIDYHIASEHLAKAAIDAKVARQPSYDTRWSDHAPVIVRYEL